MEDTFRRAAFTASVFYRDPEAALTWLEQAFGFARSMVITDPGGNFVHAEMRFGDSRLMLGAPWSGFIASPASVGGANTQTIHVHLSLDIESHCARAKAAGAEILQQPEDQFFGDRTYRARDPEGHVWTFAQTVAKVSRAEAERASGLKIEAAEWQ